MAPGGRLRIGSDGVPIKFNLHKVAASKALAGAPPAPALFTTAPAPLPAPVAAAASPSLEETGGGVDRVLSHHLQLLVALIGEEEVMTLELGCGSAWWRVWLCCARVLKQR